MSKLLFFIGGAMMGSGLTLLYNEYALGGPLPWLPTALSPPVPQNSQLPAVGPEGGCSTPAALGVVRQLRYGQGWSDNGFSVSSRRLSVWYANDARSLGVAADSRAHPGSGAQFTPECRELIFQAVGTLQQRLVAAAL